MNAVIDEDLQRSLKNILSELGFAVYDIRDYGLRGHFDDAIFRFAQKRRAVLFSADLGFSNTLRFPLGTHNGIVVLRFPNELSTSTMNEMVKESLAELELNDYDGNLLIVSPGKLRIRRYERDKD